MQAEPILITVETKINAPVAKVWENWVTPEHIIQWNAASDDWHTPSASNDLRVGGKFNYRMEAKDGSFGFDFSGYYTQVQPLALIAFKMGEEEASDAREVKIEFDATGDTTVVKETFVAENTHPVEMQRSGWQNILDRFKAHVESQV